MLSIGLGLFFFSVIVLFFKTVITLTQTLTPDFSVYYNAAIVMLEGNSVYGGHSLFTLFAYPLVSTIPFLLFTLFPYQTAQIVFLGLNGVSLIGISLVIPLLCAQKRSIIFSICIFSLSYLSFPTKFTFGMGQVNLIAYTILLFSFFFFLRKKHFLTALLFTVACICKPILGFSLLFFIINKQWKILLYSLGLLGFWFWIPLLFDKNALIDYLYYFQHVIPEISRPVGREIYYNQGISAFVFRLTTNQFARLLLSYLATICVFAYGLVTSFQQKKNLMYQFSLLLTMIPILDPMSWQHHFIFLILPFSYAAYVFYKYKQYKHLTILFIAYLLVSFNIKTPQLFQHFPFNLLLSNTFYGALLLFVLLVVKRRLFQKAA